MKKGTLLTSRVLFSVFGFSTQLMFTVNSSSQFIFVNCPKCFILKYDCYIIMTGNNQCNKHLLNSFTYEILPNHWDLWGKWGIFLATKKLKLHSKSRIEKHAIKTYKYYMCYTTKYVIFFCTFVYVILEEGKDGRSKSEVFRYSWLWAREPLLSVLGGWWYIVWGFESQ